MSLQFLLDTDTCVYWLRGRESIRERVTAVGLATLGISIITLAELRYGAACSAQPEANQRAVDAFSEGIIVIGVDASIALAFGDIKAALRVQGMLLEDSDLLIGATARTYGLTLVTNNSEHFRRIPGLSFDNWSLPI